jgi:DNA repair exonuclease SbcCD ATPase subunit
MLKKARFKNFQKHKCKTIRFSPTVTTIVGDNDKGKSSILRGLRLLFLNKLGGKPDGYVRFGASTLQVTAWIDKHIIGRRKGKGVNEYTLDGQKYKSFGQGNVPEPIAAILNVDHTNFVRQMDLPFWFSESPGQVSRNLNEIVNLKIIDDTLATVAAEARKARSQVEVSKDRLKAAKKDRADLSWVPDFVAAVRRLQGLQAAADKAAEECRLLVSLLRSARTHARIAETAGRAFLAGEKAVRAGTLARKADAEFKELASAIQEADEAREAAEVAIPDVKGLLAVRAAADRVAEGCGELEHLMLELKKEEEEICQLDDTLAVLRKKLAKVRVCPTCGRKVSSSQLLRVTSTCGTNHQSPAGKKTGGSPSRISLGKYGR